MARRWRREIGGKYVKKAHHKKKILSEKQKTKKEWREYKKLRRDKSRREPHFSFSDLDRSENSKSYRRWSRQRIAYGDFDLEKGWRKSAYYKVDWVW